MPFYTFKCPSCSQEEEILQSMNTAKPVCKRCVDASCGTHTPEMERVWQPTGKPQFIENDAPEGTEHTNLRKESDNLYRFVKGGDDSIEKTRKETMFIQLLEGLHKDEAELLCNVKDKRLHQVYKGLSSVVVKEGLGLDDDYKVI